MYVRLDIDLAEARRLVIEMDFPLARAIIESIIHDQSWPFLLNVPHPLKPRYLKVCAVRSGEPSIEGVGAFAGHVDDGRVKEPGVGGEIARRTDFEVLTSDEIEREKSAES
jgi:hypothetical protein